MQKIKFNVVSIAAFTMLTAACNNATENKTAEKDTPSAAMPAKKEYRSQLLVSHIYTADPSAHVFNGRIYVYPSMMAVYKPLTRSGRRGEASGI